LDAPARKSVIRRKHIMPVASKTNSSKKEIQLGDEEFKELVEQCAAEKTTKAHADFGLGFKHALELAKNISCSTLYDWMHACEINEWDDWLPFFGSDYFKGWEQGIRHLRFEVERRKAVRGSAK